MVKCQNCGAEVVGSDFCFNCGEKVEKFEESLSDASICFPTSIKKHAAPGIGRGVQNTVVRVT